MPQDITDQLIHARYIIMNLMGSHQSTPEHAVRYAVRHTDLPADIVPQLIEFAKEINK